MSRVLCGSCFILFSIALFQTRYGFSKDSGDSLGPSLLFIILFLWKKSNCAFQVTGLQMKFLNSLFASWVGGDHISHRKIITKGKTCVSIQTKYLEIIWSLNKLRSSILSQGFTLRTLHQVLAMWIKTFQNANIKSQTRSWKTYISTWAHTCSWKPVPIPPWR